VVKVSFVGVPISYSSLDTVHISGLMNDINSVLISDHPSLSLSGYLNYVQIADVNRCYLN